MVEHVVRTYRTPSGEVRALQDVSASLPLGGICAIVGPSGSGKSSLLRLIAGMDRPTEGSVLVDGWNIGTAPAAERRRLRRDTVGYVFQQPSANFFDDLTVAEHLQLAAGPAGGGTAFLEGILERLGIADRADHLPAELSGGEQQRAAFAQALASGARIVVADEPTAELDSASADLVLERLRSVAADGVTFVIATHDPAVIAASDHRLDLEHGRVRGSAATRTAAEGSPATSPDVRDPVGWPGAEPWTTTSAAPVLSLDGVTKSYGSGADRIHAVRQVHLTARTGEIVELVGRSGSGKTTLLNVAVGWERADAGSVQAPGGDAPTWADVAMLPQRLGLMDELTVEENVAYPARLAGRLEERRGLVGDLLEALGLTTLRRRYPRETSMGEQQRTGLARALVLAPRLLVADEPTAHLDAGWTRTIFALLADAAAVTGMCCVIATHDRSLTDRVDRTVAISDGRIVEGD